LIHGTSDVAIVLLNDHNDLNATVILTRSEVDRVFAKCHTSLAVGHPRQTTHAVYSRVSFCVGGHLVGSGSSNSATEAQWRKPLANSTRAASKLLLESATRGFRSQVLLPQVLALSAWGQNVKLETSARHLPY
jgi:hypothetical protein